MDERCADCPWFDNEKQTSCRKSPRFCDLDVLGSIPLPWQMAGIDATEAELPPKSASAGRL